MKLTDAQLIALMDAGFSDSMIMDFVHNNSIPSDLYGAVAEIVTSVLMKEPVILERIEQCDDLELLKKVLEKIEEDELFQEAAEWWSKMGIGRSDTKAIVMTYLYGSTEYGNRDEIMERIEKRAEECMNKELQPIFDRSGADSFKDLRTKAITLMVRLTRGAMAVACPSTVSTMDGIQEWAESLGARDIPYKVRTFTGFTFEQANPNTERKLIEIWEDGKRVLQLSYRVPCTDGKKLNERKMKAGAAPNTIHGHDACHMQVSVIYCDSEYFHLIHDSFATQCADTPNLAYCIRKAFIDIYDEDVLYNLYMLNDGEGNYLKEPEELGELELEDVMNSTYFFS